MTPEEFIKQRILSEYKSVRAFTQEIGVSYSTVDSMLKRGVGGAGVGTVLKVCNALNIDIESLLSTEKSSESTLSPDEMEHIKKYRTLDGYGKKMVDMILELEIQRLVDLAAEDELAPNVIELPLFDQPASAGYGNWIDEVDSELIPVPDTPTTRRADFCVRVSGDSMEPRYSDGDLVFVRQQDDVPVGDFGIWVIDGSAYIKQRAVSTLHSLNPNYEDVVRGENVFCVGKVIGKM